MKKKKISRDWVINRQKDIYYKKSKILGYRSRSAFKLIEMNEKFKFINKKTLLLDLGASPGGWAQVANKIIKKGKILAVDKSDMEKIENVEFIKGDFLEEGTKEKILIFFNDKIDVIMSDMASNTSGDKNLDSYRTGELCLEAMDLSQRILHKNGVFLSKIFMGAVFEEIRKKANKYFKKVVIYKPLSSKQKSKEIYIYCKGIHI